MRKKIGVLAIGLAVVLTGCTKVPDLSKVDNDIAAQYLADSLLKYDTHYEDALEYDHSLLNPTPTPEPTVAPATPTPESTDALENGTQANGNGETTEGNSANGASTSEGASVEGDQTVLTSVSVSDLYGLSGIEIKGSSYSVKKSYGTDYSVCIPKKGKKLLAVHFVIANDTGASKKVNLKKNKIEAGLIVNGQNLGKPLMTIVDGDLQYFNSKIGAGKKKQGVLLFEIDNSVKVSDVKVQFIKGNSEATVSVR